MFTGFMINTWVVATMVAVIAGVVGTFAVLRGSAFIAHAVPQAGFAGAAGASLIGVSTVAGLGVFALASALGIGWLSKRGRHDAMTALGLVVMLGLGALLLSFSNEYEAAVFGLLFGQVLGISNTDVLETAVLGLACIAAIVLLYRPLLLSSVLPEVGEARGVDSRRMELCFLVVVALATTMTLPIVGALLMFSLMIGPAGAARAFTRRPLMAMTLSVCLALVTVWVAIAAAYEWNWPIGFFVGVLGACFYIAGRIWARWRLGKVALPAGDAVA
jgi:zinc/manganese transport system permease protein